jgi:peptidoglycan/xylan/chitin deacetylase (PgdA/CDA1 family)
VRAPSLRPAVKTAVAAALHWTDIDRVLGRRRMHGVPLVIAYHRVVESYADEAGRTLPAMLVSTATLERQLDWLGRRFRFVSLDELFDGGSRPPVAITFDDGYQDVHDHALPLLRRKGVPAAVFVSTALVGRQGGFLHDRLHGALARAGPSDIAPRLTALGVGRHTVARLADRPTDPVSLTPRLLAALPRRVLLRLVRRLERESGRSPSSGPRTMDWPTLRAISSAGVVVGSHTRRHVLLPNERSSVGRRETVLSRTELRERLGTRVDHFAFPDGRFDRRTLRLVTAAGYRRAYTICTHRDPDRPELTIPRVVFWERTCLDLFGRFSPAIMSCQVHRVFGRPRCAHAGLGA